MIDLIDLLVFSSQIWFKNLTSDGFSVLIKLDQHLLPLRKTPAVLTSAEHGGWSRWPLTSPCLCVQTQLEICSSDTQTSMSGAAAPSAWHGKGREWDVAWQEEDTQPRPETRRLAQRAAPLGLTQLLQRSAANQIPARHTRKATPGRRQQDDSRSQSCQEQRLPQDAMTDGQTGWWRGKTKKTGEKTSGISCLAH